MRRCYGTWCACKAMPVPACSTAACGLDRHRFSARNRGGGLAGFVSIQRHGVARVSVAIIAVLA
jgi:hypothetical protein